MANEVWGLASFSDFMKFIFRLPAHNAQQSQQGLAPEYTFLAFSLLVWFHLDLNDFEFK